jgi:hypothetical protein
MDGSSTRVPDARAMRILHAVITLGLVAIAIAFGVIVPILRGPILADVPRLGAVLAAVAGALLVATLAVIRPGVPSRDASQSLDAYWAQPAARGRAVLLWVAIEGAGIISSMGYVCTGSLAAAGVALLAIVLLIMMGPARLAS